MIVLHFYLFYYELTLTIGHGYVLQCCSNKDQFFIMHSAIPCLHVLSAPECCSDC
jgi:hypothetical protein